MKNTWTTPKVKPYPLEIGKDWYVWFRFNKGNPIIISDGLNQIPDYFERLEEANALAEVLDDRLRSGWIPQQAKHIQVKAKVTILQAIDFAFKEKSKTLSDESVENYKTSINFFKNAIKELKMGNMFSISFERIHAKKALDHLKEKKNGRIKIIINIWVLLGLYYMKLWMLDILKVIL
ncbi:hypothetical protein ACL0VS_17935 [Chryseobacterium sp. PMSZPI]|uniref:hypothetical protein n=1 Tax=Chryseobacterium sp. PMSZPI TaxID=1033900 RepID=UPI00399FC118